MTFKKIADDRWRVYIHFAVREKAEAIAKYAKKNGSKLSTKSFIKLYNKSAGFALTCNDQNYLIAFCNPNKKVLSTVAVHEAYHVVCKVLRDRGVVHSEDSEEAYAYYLEWICLKLFDFLYKHDYGKK